MDKKQIGFFEEEAVEAALVHAAETIGLDEPPLWLLQESDGAAKEINGMLLQILEEPDMSDVAATVLTDRLGVEPHEYRLRLSRRADLGRSAKLRFFRLQESWKSARWSLLGLASAAAFHSPTGLVLPTISLADNLRRNLFQLESPRDDKAIIVYQSYLRSRVQLAQSKAPNHDKLPSTMDVHVATAHTDIRDTILGLTHLRSMRILEVKQWGKEAEDIQNEENRWTEVL